MKNLLEGEAAEMHFAKRSFLLDDEFKFIESWIKFTDNVHLVDDLKICRRVESWCSSLELWTADKLVATMEDIGLDHFIVFKPDEKYPVKSLFSKTIMAIGQEKEAHE